LQGRLFTRLRFDSLLSEWSNCDGKYGDKASQLNNGPKLISLQRITGVYRTALGVLPAATLIPKARDWHCQTLRAVEEIEVVYIASILTG
jgi:hypothetical protein